MKTLNRFFLALALSSIALTAQANEPNTTKQNQVAGYHHQITALLNGINHLTPSTFQIQKSPYH